MATHQILGGKVQLYQRANSACWQCSATVGRKQQRASTKEESFALAKQIAEDWYLTLAGKSRAGLLSSEKTFAQAAAQFLKEYAAITEGQRSPKWVAGHEARLRLHLMPFFESIGLSRITSGTLVEYLVFRKTSQCDKNGEPLPPSRKTLHNEIVSLRMVLKTAVRHRWLDHLPDPPMATPNCSTHGHPNCSGQDGGIMRGLTQ